MEAMAMANASSSSSSSSSSAVLSRSCVALGFGFRQALSGKPQSSSRSSSHGSTAMALSSKGFGAPVTHKKKKKHASNNKTKKGSTGKSISKESGEESDISEDEGREDASSVCPCGGGEHKLSYGECCLPYHNGVEIAPDALTLLKTRFSAYAQGVVSYIVETTHPENPDFQDDLMKNAQATCDQLKFYNLHIVDNQFINENEATVSFHAVYGPRKGRRGERRVLEEKSYFVREGEKWLFRDGEALSQVSQAEWMLAGRNAG